MKRKSKDSGLETQAFIREYFSGTVSTHMRVMETMGPGIAKAGHAIAQCLRSGGKWLLFGNGGSAADAQHLAAELVGRLYKLERRGLPALALNTDNSALTCIGNDYSFERIFSRQVEALARRGDVVMGISTSGNSPNVLEALALARKMGCYTLGLSGGSGGKMAGKCDLELRAPSDKTFHIQEAHIAIGHLICFLVEKELLESGFFKRKFEA